MSRNSRTPSWAFLVTARLGVDLHVRRRTGIMHARLQRRAAAGVDLDDAHAAHADRLHARVVAEARDVDAVALGGVDDAARPWLGLDGRCR